MYGLTATHWCCINDDLEGLKILLVNVRQSILGIESKSRPKDLSRKRSSSQSPFASFIYEAYFSNIDNKVSKQLENLPKITPVQCAVFFGSTNVVEYLIEQNYIDFDEVDEHGNDLLTYAILNEKMHIADILNKTGKFDLSKRNFQGYTSLQLCAHLGRNNVYPIFSKFVDR